MFQDLVDLFSGWYMNYVQDIRTLLETSQQLVVTDGDGTQTVITNIVNPEIWSAYVPWEHVIAAVVLVVFTVCVFKFIRSVLCKIL